ncbi:MAG: hypothetical protein ACI9AD_000279 [Nitriliruptoraceae bacterium]|jgi:hypothetical protein
MPRSWPAIRPALRPGRRRVGVAALLIATQMLVAVPALATPYPPVTSVLPPLVPAGPGRDFSDECGDDGLVCVRFVEQQLAGWESFFGCDHRAVFPTVYRLLTQETRLVLEEDPSYFDDPAGLGKEALAFYSLYEQMITDHLAGDPIPDAWQRSISAAAEGDWSGGQDMLLAINAHVQRDMPFALAATGLNLPDGTSRKGDHDLFNEVLNVAYPIIVAEVTRRYDPFMSQIGDLGDPGNIGAMQLVAGWREGVWRNAEALISTQGTPLHDGFVTALELHADTWGQAMSVGERPDRRAIRDAHCAAAMAGEPASDAVADAPDAEDVLGITLDADDVRAGALAETGGGAAGVAVVLIGLAVLLRRRRR